jgi:Zn-dependent protease
LKALLALLVAGKLGKALLSGGSMLLSVATYAFVFGWWYAIGLVALLLIHEMGHYIAARQRGLDVGLPTFIPFVGAWIQLRNQPMDAETEAFVGIAGPMLGSAAAFLCYLAAREADSRLLMALAQVGFMLNLFNLIPLSPLDGGRIVSVISPRIWFLGIPLLISLFFWKPSPILVLVAIMAAPQLWAAFRDRSVLAAVYYRAPAAVRFQYAVHYLALAGFLAIMSFESYESLNRAG